MLATVLLREPQLTRRTIDLAWTAAVVRGLCLTFVLWCLAPWLAAFWPSKQQVLTDYFRLSALAFGCNGLVNLHAVNLRRELRFVPAFLIENVAPITASAFALVLLALEPAPIWLVAALPVGAASASLLSLLLVRPRPRFDWDRAGWAQLWRSCAPLLGNGILGYLLLAGDVFVVEAMAGVVALGIYGMGQRWSQMPMKMVVQGLQNVLLPVYVRIRDDLARTRHVAVSTMSTMLAVVGFGAGLMLVFAPDFFALLGGGKWHEAAAVARAFVPFSLAFAVNGSLGQLLVVHGKLPWLNRIMTAQLVGFVPAMYVGHLAFGLPGAALGVSTVLVGTALAMMFMSEKLLELPRFTCCQALLAPLTSAAIAASTAWVVVLPLTAPMTRLCVGSAVALAAFVASWELLSRRPFAQRLQTRSLLQLARLLAR
jgi:O-antigen/teichoic acid export membrane protein